MYWVYSFLTLHALQFHRSHEIVFFTLAFDKFFTKFPLDLLGTAAVDILNVLFGINSLTILLRYVTFDTWNTLDFIKIIKCT